jgi:hypothetical protein
MQGTDNAASTNALLFRFAASVSVVAMMLGVLAPALRGNASTRIVEWVDQLANTFAYGMFALLVVAIVRAAIVMGASARFAVTTRVVLLANLCLVVALAAPALKLRLPAQASISLAVVASSLGLLGALLGVRNRDLRAAGVVLGLTSIAGLVRAGAWQLAGMAGTAISTRMYTGAQVASTVGLVLETAAIGTTIVWTASRPGPIPRAVTFVAIGMAILSGWAGRLGALIDAPSWMQVLHGVFPDLVGSPRPLVAPQVVVFVIATGSWLAFWITTTPLMRHAGAVSIVLALVARGTHDVPLRALSLVVSALCILHAYVSEPHGELVTESR